jgi:hypothetical protein
MICESASLMRVWFVRSETLPGTATEPVVLDLARPLSVPVSAQIFDSHSWSDGKSKITTEEVHAPDFQHQA